MTSPTPALSFAQLLQDFFCKYLLGQRNASPRTISSYRDAFRLLLRYVQDRARKPVATLTLAELDAPVLLAFLEYLERDRRNGIRSRNARLAALRSFYRYAATREPLSLPIAQRVLGSLRSGTTVRCSGSSLAKRWMPCSAHPMPAPGAGVAIARYWQRCTIRARASQRPLACAPPMSTQHRRRPLCTSEARVERNVAFHCGRRPPGSLMLGSTRTPGPLSARSSRMIAAMH
jgi:hypothetical protein